MNEFLRMRFALSNASTTFQRVIDIILSGVKWRNCRVYLDDVIVFSRNVDDHVHHVDEVPTLLRNAGVTLRLKKCAFFQQTVECPGHQITPGKLGVLEANTRALRDARHPTTRTPLKSVLGMCNVFRRFVKDSARIAKLLTVLTSSALLKVLQPPSPNEGEAFDSLKQALLAPPVLALPHRRGTSVIDVDACDTRVGCTLLQGETLIGTDNAIPDLHPVGYFSRTLNQAERSYSATERECLRVIWAVQLLRPHLEGSRFIARSDHEPLRWLLNLGDMDSDSHGLLAR